VGLFPQWDGRGWGGADVSRLLIEILAYEQTQLQIDPDRVYLTGQSMGGYGAYFTVIHYPKTFAAVVPISGEWGPFGKGKGIAVPGDLSRWKHLPYWAAHGMKDHVVPYRDGKGTVHEITARAPDKGKGEVFAGWTCETGSAFEHTTTNQSNNRGRFADAEALTTRFKMGVGDVILEASYKIVPR